MLNFRQPNSEAAAKFKLQIKEMSFLQVISTWSCTMHQFLQGRELGRSDQYSLTPGGSTGGPAPGWEVCAGSDKEVDTRH